MQIITWLAHQKDSTEWGWWFDSAILSLVQTSNVPAPDILINLILCKSIRGRKKHLQLSENGFELILINNNQLTLLQYNYYFGSFSQISIKRLKIIFSNFRLEVFEFICSGRQGQSCQSAWYSGN